MVAPPLDVDLVQSAIRLGWYVAEVRGRNRPGGPPGAAVDVPPVRIIDPDGHIVRGLRQTGEAKMFEFWPSSDGPALNPSG